MDPDIQEILDFLHGLEQTAKVKNIIAKVKNLKVFSYHELFC